MSEFTVGDDHFRLDGRPVRLLSGALHYFRVHEEQWATGWRCWRRWG